MRYFVYQRGDGVAGHSFVLAEVMRDEDDDGRFRASGLGSNVAGDAAEILTLDEMLGNVESARALAAWEGKDDRVFEQDARRIVAEDARPTRGRHLRIVRERPAEPAEKVANEEH